MATFPESAITNAGMCHILMLFKLVVHLPIFYTLQEQFEDTSVWSCQFSSPIQCLSAEITAQITEEKLEKLGK